MKKKSELNCFWLLLRVITLVRWLQEEYKKQLAENLLQADNGQRKSRILAFKSKPPAGFENDSRKLLYTQNVATGQMKPRKVFRHIPQTAERTLDAPDLLDDYYLNLLDWSANNVLAVALGNTVYLWDATTSSIEELLVVDEEGPVTSVSWASDGKYLAVGLNNSVVQLWDSQSLRQVFLLFFNPSLMMYLSCSRSGIRVPGFACCFKTVNLYLRAWLLQDASSRMSLMMNLSFCSWDHWKVTVLVWEVWLGMGQFLPLADVTISFSTMMVWICETLLEENLYQNLSIWKAQKLSLPK